jgi:hypothetical protein
MRVADIPVNAKPITPNEGATMPNESHTQGLEHELNDALDDLRLSLQHASDATASIQRLIPRVTQIGSLFDELAAVISTGREQLGITTPAGAMVTRPTLLVPATPRESAPTLAADKDPWTELSNTWNSEEPVGPAPAPSSAALVSFRLEFESRPGPLDLRTVDDAVSEHPSVRDVALIDYDGRKATLKVWIEESAKPADVHASLVEKASSLFGPDNEVTVIAIEDAAA